MPALNRFRSRASAPADRQALQGLVARTLLEGAREPDRLRRGELRELTASRRGARRARQAARPSAAKPISVIAQVEGSGAADGSIGSVGFPASTSKARSAVIRLAAAVGCSSSQNSD